MTIPFERAAMRTTDDPRIASAMASRLLATAPDDEEARIFRAYARRSLGEDWGAWFDARLAMALSGAPNRSLSALLGDLERRVRPPSVWAPEVDLEPLVARRPEALSEVLAALAWLPTGMEDEVAEWRARIAREVEPGAARLSQARAFGDAGNVDAALESLGVALCEDPGLREAIEADEAFDVLEGTPAYYELLAEAALDEGTRIHRLDADLRYGAACLASGQAGRAAQILERALATASQTLGERDRMVACISAELAAVAIVNDDYPACLVHADRARTVLECHVPPSLTPCEESVVTRLVAAASPDVFQWLVVSSHLMVAHNRLEQWAGALGAGYQAVRALEVTPSPWHGSVVANLRRELTRISVRAPELTTPVLDLFARMSAGDDVRPSLPAVPSRTRDPHLADTLPQAH